MMEKRKKMKIRGVVPFFLFLFFLMKKMGRRGDYNGFST
jgi:hypothetical protein